MALRKAIVFGAFVLALAMLSPVSALANTETHRCPVRGSGSGTASLNLPTLTFKTDTVGVTSCVGLTTSHSEGSGAFNPDGTFAGNGNATIVAANGDQLAATFTLATSDVTPTTHTSTVIATVTGGTGRFAGASGTLTLISHVKLESVDPATGTAYNTSEYTVTGEIRY